MNVILRFLLITILIFFNQSLLGQSKNYKVVPFSYKDAQYGFGIGYEKFLGPTVSFNTFLQYRIKKYIEDFPFESEIHRGAQLSLGIRNYLSVVKSEKLKPFVGVSFSVNYVNVDYIGIGGQGNSGGVEFNPEITTGLSILVSKKIHVEVIPNVGYKINALESIPIDSPFGPNASKFTRLSNGLNYGLTIALAYHI